MDNLTEKKFLRELSLQSTNVSIVAIIIGKSEPRFFTIKRPTESNPDQQNAQRGILTLTVRDSKRHFTNCKFWGSHNKVMEYNQIFHIGDAIVIVSPKLLPPSSLSSQYEPKVPLPFSLVVNEGIGHIEHRFGNTTDVDELRNLSKFPLKSLADVLNLADISCGSQQHSGQHVDLLVLVKFVKPIRSIQMKNGEIKECLEVIVIDKSLTNGILFTIWNHEWVKRAKDKWKPLSTVLHLIDIRVSYSTFYKSAILGLSGKTLISENPIAEEVDALLLFANSISFYETGGFFENISKNLPNPDSITNVMTVHQIYDRAEGHLKDDSEEFTAMLYAMFTKIDLDGLTKVISKKCLFCKRFIKLASTFCENEQCQMNYSLEHTEEKYEYYFDINVHLTDHTGTLTEGNLSHHIAEMILGISCKNFLKLNDEQKTTLKWKFLLERYQVKLVVRKQLPIRKSMMVIILDAQKVELNDIFDKILVY